MATDNSNPPRFKQSMVNLKRTLLSEIHPAGTTTEDYAAAQLTQENIASLNASGRSEVKKSSRPRNHEHTRHRRAAALQPVNLSEPRSMKHKSRGASKRRPHSTRRAQDYAPFNLIQSNSSITTQRLIRSRTAKKDRSPIKNGERGTGRQLVDSSGRPISLPNAHSTAPSNSYGATVLSSSASRFEMDLTVASKKLAEFAPIIRQRRPGFRSIEDTREFLKKQLRRSLENHDLIVRDEKDKYEGINSNPSPASSDFKPSPLADPILQSTYISVNEKKKMVLNKHSRSHEPQIRPKMQEEQENYSHNTAEGEVYAAEFNPSPLTGHPHPFAPSAESVGAPNFVDLTQMDSTSDRKEFWAAPSETSAVLQYWDFDHLLG